MVFDNHFVNVIGGVAIAMGNYYFTSCADGSKTKVEYTFGYAKNSDGKEGVSKDKSFSVIALLDLWSMVEPQPALHTLLLPSRGVIGLWP